MQQQQRAHTEECRRLLEEVERLREEKEEQQNLLAQSLVLSEDARVEARLKHEITRLARENLVGRSASCRLHIRCFLPGLSRRNGPRSLILYVVLMEVSLLTRRNSWSGVRRRTKLSAN